MLCRHLAVIALILGATCGRCLEPNVAVADFARGPGAWQINSRQGAASRSRVVEEERGIRLEAVFDSGWEAFKLPVPAGQIPVDQRTLLFAAKAGPGVRGVEVKLGLADGSWWRAQHALGSEWQEAVLRDIEFQCCHPPLRARAPFDRESPTP